MTGQQAQAAQSNGAGQRSPQPHPGVPSDQRPDPEELQQTTLESLVAEVSAAALYEEGFVRQVSAGLRALLETLALDPNLAHLAMLEVRELGSPGYRPYRRTLARLTSLFESMLEVAEIEVSAPQTTAVAVVSGVVSTVAREVEQGRTAALIDLHPELVFLVLVPYVGAEAAAAEMHRCRERPA